MQNSKIAVEDQLTNVKKMLEERGYTVVSPKNAGDVTAVVVTGMDNNLMNMQNITTKAPVIDATGKDLYEILSLIRELEI